MRYEFLYRDGANYKTTLVGDVYRELEIGQEITMEKLGYPEVYFHREFIESKQGPDWKYDSEVDHNILYVTRIPDENEPIDFTAQQLIEGYE